MSSDVIAENEAQYKQELREALSEGTLDRLSCCELFLDPRRTMALICYHENIGDGLDKFARVQSNYLFKNSPDPDMSFISLLRARAIPLTTLSWNIFKLSSGQRREEYRV